MTQDTPETVVVHAPYGRDAALICKVLARAGISASACPTVDHLCSLLSQMTGAALISDEALTVANVSALASIVHAQPPWSDLPLIVTTSGGEATAASQARLRLLEPLGNVSLLERPLRTVTLISAVQIALRARRRQYQLRENFAERERLVRELERSNDELAQFAHIVSHDLQAPIRMVRSFSELLYRSYHGRLDATADKFMQAIQNSASIMEELVRTLLHYATFGQEPMTRTTVDLSEVVRAVLITLQPAIEDLTAYVTFGDLPVICGDRLQLEQLIQNLLGNALKYSIPGVRPIVHIFSERGSVEWTVYVRDNGPGIAAQNHAHIFKPLKRLHGKSIAGTGMGLAVCRKIVERHGGRIWVESEPSAGATFCFTIPVGVDGAHNVYRADNTALEHVSVIHAR